MSRLTPIAVLFAVLMTACGGGSALEDYYELMAEIGRDQDARSAEIVAPGTTPARTQIAEIVDLRRQALEELRRIEPPDEVAGLHGEFVGSLEEVVTLAETFLADTEDLDARAFAEALANSTEIDEAQRRFTAFCRTLEIEADALDVGPVDLSC
ncbi:MAG: hypothetical protein R3290_10155 [Acidimicrobiia bacterium]|nr:hypothetical protein [Acidimicrobiia bacterium]